MSDFETGGKPKIGVFSKPLDNWTSGSGHHLDEMMKRIISINEAEGSPFDFYFIHYRKSENPVYSRVKEILIPRNPIAAAGVLRPYGFSLLHYSPLSIYAPMFRLKAKKIATIHGAEEVIYPQGYSFIAKMHEKYAMPVLARKLDAIATVSQASKRYYVSDYKVKPERVFLTPNGFSSEFRRLPSDSVEKALTGMGVRKPYVLHISRYSMRKNPECVLGSFALFAEKHPDWFLVCAGKGWDSPEVAERAKALGVKNFITPGFVSESQAAVLYNGAEVFVFPSFAEGFGMPNVEAMACGCPVVTSSVFAIPEVVGDAAVLLKDMRDSCECASAIEKICSDKAFRDTLVNAGLQRCKLYNWNESAAILFAKYKELLSLPSHASP